MSDKLEKIRDHIQMTQKYSIMRLKDNCHFIIKSSEALLDKIEVEDDNGYYSTRHEVLQRASEISRICNELSHLRQWKETIDKAK